MAVPRHDGFLVDMVNDGFDYKCDEDSIKHVTRIRIQHVTRI